MSGSPIIFSKIFTLINPDTTQFGFNYKVALLEIFNITMIIFIGTGIGFLVSSSINVLAFLSYFGGIATMIIMGFSPTLYASSDRPRFVGYFLILCSIFGCISTIYKDINIHPFLSDH